MRRKVATTHPATVSKKKFVSGEIDDPRFLDKDKSESFQSVIESLITIQQREPEAFEVLKDILNHISNTYGDKYQQNHLNWIQTKGLLLGPTGKMANMHCALKYQQRYLSEGSEKSYNTTDLLKTVHYLLFELQRRKKHA